MRVSEVSKRYSKALLAAAKTNGVEAKVQAELEAIQTAFESDITLVNFFKNPMVTAEQKITVIKNTFSNKAFTEELINTLALLAEKGRLGILTELSVAYRDLLDLENGITRGVVKSAQALSAEAKQDIEKKITKVLNKKLVLSYEQDPKILGGVTATVGGWTFDDSIDTHLKKLNEELNRRAN